MARGSNDFGNIGAAFAANQMDTADIQETLTGIGLLDGLGKTVYFDNFKNGLGGFAKLAEGAGVAPVLADVNENNIGGIYSPPYSAKCTTGDNVADKSSLVFRAVLRNQSKLGLEFGYTFISSTSDFDLNMDFWREGGSAKKIGLRASIANNTLELATGAIWQSLGQFRSFLTGNVNRMQIKIVGDFETQMYKKLLVGEKSYDVNQYALGNSTFGNPTGLYIKLAAVSYGAGSTPIYFGYFRLSKDEP